MAIYHCSIKIISRGKGKSAVAAAAYRAGQTFTNEYDGVTHDYTRKGGVVHIWYEAPEEEKNFITLLDMINASEAREDDEDFKNPVDLLFDRLAEKEPEHFAVKQYAKYKLAAGVIS